MLRKLARNAGCAALFAGVMACQPVERVRECRHIATLVNPVMVAIDIQRKKSPTDARTYRGIAASYELLANALGTIHVRPKRFEDALGDYQRMLHEARHDATSYADALEARDSSRLASTRAAAARTVKHEGQALSRLDAVCNGR
jgi:hypothetical protein